MGFANYDKRFIKDFAAIVDPLKLLTRKEGSGNGGPINGVSFSN